MLIYKIVPHQINILEIQLVSMSSHLIEYLRTQRVYITRKGVMILYTGSQFILEEDQGSIGDPNGAVVSRCASITIPDVQSEKSIELEPQKGRLIRPQDINDTCMIRFRCTDDRNKFIWSIIAALNELSGSCRSALRGVRDKDESLNPFVILGGLTE